MGARGIIVRVGRRLRHLGGDRTGVSAVEFAIISPLFLTMLFGIIAFGQIIGVQHGLQQLAAEAARATVAGLSDGERDRLARSFVAANVGAYAGLEAAKLQVTVGAPAPSTTAVTLDYDLSENIAYRFLSFVPLPEPLVRRTATIQRGGY